jgi:hypothetical protein
MTMDIFSFLKSKKETDLEPGSIQDYARAYSKSFKEQQKTKIVSPAEFNKVFNKVLIAREEIYERIGITNDNLWMPVRTKGVDEVHSVISVSMQSGNLDYKCDLPTMILYALILESKVKRKDFAEMSEGETLAQLKVLRDEVNRVCDYQVQMDELTFCRYNYYIIQQVIMDCDKDFAISIATKMNLLDPIEEDPLEPGSIGDYARTYAKSFFQIAPGKIFKKNEFDKHFTDVLQIRAEICEKGGLAEENLFMPLHLKGINQIHKYLSGVCADNNILYELDLPMMILYAILLESKIQRLEFTFYDQASTKKALKVLWDEVANFSHRQVIIEKDVFISFNSAIIPYFIRGNDPAVRFTL